MYSAEDRKYITELAETIKELVISKSELAKLIEVSDKTVSRYFAEQSKIKNENKKKIQELIETRSKYGEYKHKPTEIFAKLFQRLLDEFKEEITQEELAKLAGFSGQSQISKISSGEKQLSTEDQYNILSIFLSLCTNQNAHNIMIFDAENIFSKHYNTARELYGTLYGNINSFEDFEEYEKNNEYSNYAIKLTLINYFTTLPYEAQEIIINAPDAFFDSLQILYFADSPIYPNVSSFLNRFREIPFNARHWFQSELEQLVTKKKVFSYYDFKDNWKLFDIVTQYRKMIKNARDRRIADPRGAIIYFGERIDGYEQIENYSIDNLKNEDKDKNIDIAKQTMKFERVIHDLIVNDNRFSTEEMIDYIIDDIEARLVMSPYEWYMWMLYASYLFAYQEDSEIFDLMNKVIGVYSLKEITDFIRTLPSSTQEFILKQPMAFFDSLSICELYGEDKIQSICYYSAELFFEQFNALNSEAQERFIEMISESFGSECLESSLPAESDEKLSHYYMARKNAGAFWSENHDCDRKIIQESVFDNSKYEPNKVDKILFGFDIYKTYDETGYKILARDVINDLTFRLNMTDKEWGIWLTVMKFVFSKKETFDCNESSDSLKAYQEKFKYIYFLLDDAENL